MATIMMIIGMEIDSNPKILPSTVKGNTSVIPATSRVVIRRYLLGILLKNDPLDRITNTIKLAEITDSTNQPVLNKTKSLLKTRRRTPKVT